MKKKKLLNIMHTQLVLDLIKSHFFIFLFVERFLKKIFKSKIEKTFT